MAKFVYRMQNILELKEKMETQEKMAFAIANAKLQEELDKAVEEENYRLASYIQEELNKRKQQNQSDQAE